MIEIALKDLEKYYGAHHVLKGIRFEILHGEKVGLIGVNGCGKTTLFKIISGLENYEKGMLSIRKGTTIGYLHQIPQYTEDATVLEVLNTAFEALWDIKKRMACLEEKLSIFEGECLDRAVKEYGELQIAFEVKGGYALEEQFSKVCSGLKITPTFQERKFNSLSGGEKTTVQLGKILLQHPDILLLDEPTNHLDMESIEWLEDFLQNYPGTAVIISHDRYFLDAAVQKIIEVDEGEATIYLGNYSYFIEEKERRLLEQFEAFKDQQKKFKAMEEAITRFRDWGTRSDNPAMFKKAAHMEKRMAKMEKIDRPLLERRKIGLQFTGDSRSGKDVFVAQALHKSFGNQSVLCGIDVHVRFGEKIALLGKNGTGKSTFLKLLLNEYEPDLGEIKRGSNVRIGYLEQDIVFPQPEQTVLEAFRDGLTISEGEARKQLAKFLFYGEEVFKRVKSLSGGQKSRLKLCQLMMQDINLLILDEPTNHLDIDSREMLEDALTDFEGTLLFISHDRYFINKLAYRIVELQDGKLHTYEGNYDVFREKKASLLSRPPILVKKITPKSAKQVSENRDEKKLEKQILQLEEDMANLQRLIHEKEQFMEIWVNDYEKLQAIFEERSILRSKLDVLMEEWITLCEAQSF